MRVPRLFELLAKAPESEMQAPSGLIDVSTAKSNSARSIAAPSTSSGQALAGNSPGNPYSFMLFCARRKAKSLTCTDPWNGRSISAIAVSASAMTRESEHLKRMQKCVRGTKHRG